MLPFATQQPPSGPARMALPGSMAAQEARQPEVVAVEGAPTGGGTGASPACWAGRGACRRGGGREARRSTPGCGRRSTWRPRPGPQPAAGGSKRAPSMEWRPALATALAVVSKLFPPTLNRLRPF